MKKKEWALITILAILLYVAWSSLFGLGIIITSGFSLGILGGELKNIVVKLILSIAISSLLVMSYSNKDSNIKRKNTGQFGNAKFLDEEEVNKFLKVTNLNKSTIKPGFLLGSENGKFKMEHGDKHALLLAPPGTGKTLRVLVPTIMQNAIYNQLHPGEGYSMMFADVKGELYEKCSAMLKQSGYEVVVFNFRNPLQSHNFNMMSLVNKHLKLALETDDEKIKVIEFAKCEKYAKILSDSLVNSNQNKTTSGADEFFSSASLGLLTSLILLISQFGNPNEKHLSSVYSLIVELNGVVEEDANSQNNKLKAILIELEQLVEGQDFSTRSKLYAGASISADIRTSMNIFSSALTTLSSLIDIELEQMLCSEFDDFNAEDFIEKPTALFLIIPDENSTRHFMASLIFKNVTNELIAIAETTGGKLSRKVLFILDEFGNLPAIKDFDVIATAIRSRGGYIMIALQSFAQLKKTYGDDRARIIRDCFQITLIGALSPTAIDDQKMLSEMAGHYTGTSYSTSSGSNRGAFAILHSSTNESYSEQLIKKNLIEPYEFQFLKKGEFIIYYHTEGIFKSHLDIVFDLFKNKRVPFTKKIFEEFEYPNNPISQIHKVDVEDIKRQAYLRSNIHKDKIEAFNNADKSISKFFEFDSAEFI